MRRVFVTLLMLLTASLGGSGSAGTAPAEGMASVEASTAKTELVALRAFPVPEKWIIPTRYYASDRPPSSTDFRAEATGGEGIGEYAEWHLEGAGSQTVREKASHAGGAFKSTYRLKPQRPGEYRLTCSFVDKGVNRSSVSWSITVAPDAYAPYGRNDVAPTEPGTMVLIKGGTFLMGPPDAAHEEQVGDFNIGKYLVTAGEFCHFLNERGNADYRYMYEDEKRQADLRKRYPGAEHSSENVHCSVFRDPASGKYMPRGGLRYAPADQVTWFGAVEYCKWLSERTGKIYRLPSRAEWEYAARGREGRKYPWGSYEPVPKGYSTNPGQFFEYCQGAAWINVGSFPEAATPEGLQDMAGGIQWCSDLDSKTGLRTAMGNLGRGSYSRFTWFYHYFTHGAWQTLSRRPEGGLEGGLEFRVVMETGGAPGEKDGIGQ
jgi:formylglycine-generating enzyme required for sulfatase activity